MIQGNLPYCGAIVFLQLLGFSRPTYLYDLAMKLFVEGRAKVNQFEIKANYFLRNKKNFERADAVDFLLAFAVRSSKNKIFPLINGSTKKLEKVFDLWLTQKEDRRKCGWWNDHNERVL